MTTKRILIRQYPRYFVEEFGWVKTYVILFLDPYAVLLVDSEEYEWGNQEFYDDFESDMVAIANYNMHEILSESKSVPASHKDYEGLLELAQRCWHDEYDEDVELNVITAKGLK